MGAQGTTTVNFGAFPGASDATVVITGQTSIQAASLVEAWIFPSATADHSVDEHWVDPPDIFAGNIVAGTGFTIYARQAIYPYVDDGVVAGPVDLRNSNNNAPLVYGLWTVAWVWN
jgi:hypothetical protein